MSSEAASSSSPYSPPKPPQSPRCIELSNPPYELHCAVYNNNLETVKGILNKTKDAVNVSDKHGTFGANTKQVACYFLTFRQHASAPSGDVGKQRCV